MSNKLRLTDSPDFRIHDAKYVERLDPKVDGILYELRQDFDYCVGGPDTDDVIHIPKGFLTDFASIPRPLRIFFPMRERISLAPIPHDWLYATHSRPKNEADDIYYEAMIALDYNPKRAYIQYQAVKQGGHKAYEEAPTHFKRRTPELHKSIFG